MIQIFNRREIFEVSLLVTDETIWFPMLIDVWKLVAPGPLFRLRAKIRITSPGNPGNHARLERKAGEMQLLLSVTTPAYLTPETAFLWNRTLSSQKAALTSSLSLVLASQEPPWWPGEGLLCEVHHKRSTGCPQECMHFTSWQLNLENEVCFTKHCLHNYGKCVYILWGDTLCTGTGWLALRTLNNWICLRCPAVSHVQLARLCRAQFQEVHSPQLQCQQSPWSWARNELHNWTKENWFLSLSNAQKRESSMYLGVHSNNKRALTSCPRGSFIPFFFKFGDRSY